MKLAIADPPYLGRSNRWYGDGRGHAAGRAADGMLALVGAADVEICAREEQS